MIDPIRTLLNLEKKEKKTADCFASVGFSFWVIFFFNYLFLTTIITVARNNEDWMFHKKMDSFGLILPILSAALIWGLQNHIAFQIDFHNPNRLINKGEYFRLAWGFIVAGWIPLLCLAIHPPFQESAAADYYWLAHILASLIWTVLVVLSILIGNDLPKVKTLRRLVILAQVYSCICIGLIGFFSVLIHSWSYDYEFSIGHVFRVMDSLFGCITFVLFPLGLIVLILQIQDKPTTDQQTSFVRQFD